jgi:hypothetical protein
LRKALAGEACITAERLKLTRKKYCFQNTKSKASLDEKRPEPGNIKPPNTTNKLLAEQRNFGVDPVKPSHHTRDQVGRRRNGYGSVFVLPNVKSKPPKEEALLSRFRKLGGSKTLLHNGVPGKKRRENLQSGAELPD